MRRFVTKRHVLLVGIATVVILWNAAGLVNENWGPWRPPWTSVLTVLMGTGVLIVAASVWSVRPRIDPQSSVLSKDELALLCEAFREMGRREERAAARERRRRLKAIPRQRRTSETAGTQQFADDPL